jgi:hypothetical protein
MKLRILRKFDSEDKTKFKDVLQYEVVTTKHGQAPLGDGFINSKILSEQWVDVPIIEESN